VGGGAV